MRAGDFDRLPLRGGAVRRESQRQANHHIVDGEGEPAAVSSGLERLICLTHFSKMIAIEIIANWRGPR